MARGRRLRVEEFSDDEENHDHNEPVDEDLGYSAATAINHPHKAPRLSNVAFQATGFDKSNIIQPLSQMKDVLLTLLQRFKSNKEEIALTQLQTWSERILALSRKIILIEYKFLHADPIMNDHLNEYISSEGNHQFDVSSTGNSSSSAMEPKLKLPNTTLMIEQINQKIDEELEKISVTDHDFFVKVNQISKKISGVEDDDEDFEIVEHEEEMSAESFKCPVTKMAMTNPMKNCNPNKTQSCIHTVSKEGLELLMKGKGQISCPVGGCSGRWMKNHIAVDDNFLRKIKKFERQQTLRSQVLGQFASQSTSNRTAAIALDDD